MDLLNRLLPNRSKPTNPSASSSSSAGSSSDEDCSVCASPCSVHPSYPAHLKIEQGDMRGSVKRHRRHILVAQGRAWSRWPEEVTDQHDAFVSLLSQLVRQREGQIGYKVRVSETDLQPADEDEEAAAEEVGEAELRLREARRADRADLYVFPDMLHFPGVSRAALPQWVDGLLVHDKGAMHFKRQHATAADRLSQALRAAAVGEQPHSEPQLPDVDFECRPLVGCALLICAHKQRDKRCGVTGPILAKQIQLESSERQQAAEREADMAAQQRIRDGLPPLSPASLPSQQPLPVRTMLISHIGGHKYAGNVIAYPAGVWYGRVTPCHVHLILDAHATQPSRPDESSSDSNSGSSSSSSVVQQRIAASRRQLDELRRGEVELEW